MSATSIPAESAAVDKAPERLHTRIVTVFSLLALAPLVLGTLISLIIAISLHRHEVANDQHRVATTIGDLLNVRWSETTAGLRSAAAVIGEKSPDTWITMTLLRRSCADCRTIWLLDQAGRPRQMIGVPAPVPPLAPDIRAALARGDEAVPTNPSLDSAPAEILLAWPIRSSGETRGTLLALLDLQQFGHHAVAAIHTGDDGYSYVVDANARLIISPDAAAAPPGRDMRAVPIVAAALNNEPWEAPRSQVYAGLLTPRVDGVWHHVPALGWYVLVEAPFSISGRTNWIFGLNQLLLLILTAVMALVLGRRLAATITRPIEHLQRGVTRLRSGEWPRPLVVARRDEIGQLAAAFNAMSGALQSQQTEIKARSEQLALANHELQKALDDAVEASRIKSQFVATISHELRTPLTGVLGFSEMLEMGLYGALQGDQLDAIARIHENGQHLLELINDLLDFSKLEAGKMELEDRGFNLAEQIGAVVGNCESQALSKGLKIETQVDPNLPAVVRGDALRLRQILLNLLSNAIKFTDAGTIAVRAQAGGERSAATRSGSPQPIGSAEHGIHTVVIEVEDPGIGIAPEDQPFIFDAFRQVDGSYTRRQEGTGLGLAITRRLIDLMGGNIALDSASGRGSRFIVTLPFNAADETA